MKLFCSLVQSPEVTVGAVTVMSRLWLCVSGTTWYHCEAAKILGRMGGRDRESGMDMDTLLY